MASAFAIEVAKTLASSLGSYAKDQLLLAWGLNDEVKKLRRTMQTIHAVLKDQSETRLQRSSADEDWLNNLRDVLYELDDIFDEIVTKDAMKKLMGGNVVIKEVKLFFSPFNQLYTTIMLSQRIKSFREFLDSISKDHSNIGISIRPPPIELESLVGGEVRTDMYDDDYRPDKVVGRETDKKLIMNMLLADSSSDEPVSVIPIVGVGGLGKTTLARHVFNDDVVKEHFDLRLWVSVPREMKLKEVLEKIVAAMGESVGNYDLDQLKIHLSGRINGKRYILVLDNVWDENPLRWQDLKPMLTLGAARGSKILVTTRSLTVGNIMGTVKSYELQPLDEEDSWTLFERIVFYKKGCHESGVREIGMEIVGMCKNVPLVIRALAGVLATKYTVRQWLAFKNDEFSSLASYGEGFDVMPILRLSYDHLKPANLKSIFSYCSLFPREYVFDKSKLVYLCISQGLVDPFHKDQSLEDAGEDYISILVARGLLQEVQGEESHDTCKLHDLMYDLSCSVAGGQCKMLRSREDSDFGSSIIHISIDYQVDSGWRTPDALRSIERLRTFLLPERPSYEANMSKSVCDDLISSFLCLRALDLHHLGIKELPNSIGKLIHLRYLDLSFNSFKELPDSITLLHNLQCLDLFYCDKLTGLPKDMRKLVNLRYLRLYWYKAWEHLRYFPSGFGNLRSLHTLSMFVVPDPQECKKTKNLCGGNKSNYARLSDLNSVNKLRGELTIVILGSYQNMVLDAEKANLKAKEDLECLRFYFEGQENEMLLEKLQPHTKLPELYINGFQGKNLPTWMTRNQLALSLPHLTSITIHTCLKIKHIPSFARLPNLKSILLYSLPHVEYIENDDDQYELSSLSSSSQYSSTTFFPSLTRLEIGHLHKLKGWGRSRAGELSFPCVSVVRIYHCYMLEFMPPCPKVEHLLALYVPQNLQMLSTSGINSSSSSSKLEKLEVSSVEYLLSLPKECIQKVSKLTFCWSSQPLNFARLAQGLEGMTALRSLTFEECRGLISLSGLPVQLIALESLHFYKCHWTMDFIRHDDDDEMSGTNAWKVLKSLSYLKFEDNKTMRILPRGIQHVTTLESLELSSCQHLGEIPSWIGHLCSLSRLVIYDCPELTSLPQEMKKLKNLKQLVVDKCPQLAEKCQRETGEDWHKIQHIPQVIVRR